MSERKYRDIVAAEDAAAVRTAPRPYLSEPEHRRLKSQLTRAKNKGDGRAILKACEEAVEAFNATVWPDDWNTWRIALDDTATRVRYADHDDDLADELSAASRVLFRL